MDSDMKTDSGTTQNRRLSSFPLMKKSMKGKLDTNEDGNLDVTAAVNTLMSKHNQNKTLTNVIICLSIGGLVLIAALFGVSIAAAYVAKDVSIDPVTGFVTAKGGAVMMKTTEATILNHDANFVTMSPEELQGVERIVGSEGEFSFDVKGYSRKRISMYGVLDDLDVVTFLVEGGTLTYDTDGFVNATGAAVLLLELGDDNAGSGRRKLFHIQQVGAVVRAGSVLSQNPKTSKGSLIPESKSSKSPKGSVSPGDNSKSPKGPKGSQSPSKKPKFNPLLSDLKLSYSPSKSPKGSLSPSDNSKSPKGPRGSPSPTVRKDAKLS